MFNENDPKPWLDEKGRPLSTAQLREVSRSWDKETWRAYLNSLDHTRTEHLADDFEDLLKLHDREEALRCFYETELCDSCSCEGNAGFNPNLVAKAMSGIPHLEREILFLHFWEKKTEEEIAQSLEHSRGKIRRRYLSGLEKMKKALKDQVRDQNPHAKSA